MKQNYYTAYLVDQWGHMQLPTCKIFDNHHEADLWLDRMQDLWGADYEGVIRVETC